MAFRREHRRNGRPHGARVDVLSQPEVEALADRTAAEMLGLASRKEAFAKLDRGELRGTAAEFEFKSLRHLLED